MGGASSCFIKGIASRTVSKNRLHHHRPPHDSDKNYSLVEGFVRARCILDQKIRKKKGEIGGPGS